MEVALEQYASFQAEVQGQIDVRVEQLLENPCQPDAGYDARTDQWTTTYGDGIRLIVYAVVHERQQVIILRLV